MNEEQQHETDASVAEATGQRPAARFSGTGGVSVAVWKSKNDDGRDRYAVRIDRSYRLEDGKYESTAYLRDSDLLRAKKLLEQADEWIEQDKAKGRAASAAAAR